ncbi:chromosome segregation protein SMC [Capsulimonas corticalis]|uniref:Chromosome segregation protein SMC n=1 Tax=Capsulimonas corticalis TaxID=2219043 RepID=A0A402CTZ0_9BACT|nr:AAA family ATPase [Capsulimonas corticalis]BDI28799.1 chromosome segregation protein SMC [Capsulimonas corticalis]
MPAIEKISIKGFKSIASIEDLALGAVNIVIGPNGSGKSNFIGVFSFLHAIREGQLQDYVTRAGGADKILHFGAKTTEKIEINVTFQEAKNRYRLSLIPTVTDEFITSDVEMAEVDRTHLDRWRIYHFHDTSTNAPIKKTSDVNDNRFLRADGANLAAFLYFLRLKHSGSYSLIRRSIQRVAPFFDDFMLEPQNLNPEKIRLEWRHKESDAYFDVSSLSDGTLRFIALATLFLQPAELLPSVILVDEPELGLHPYAITMLASLVKQASVHAQVILSTQSPQLLDQFEPEDVLVAQRVDGGTQFTRLDAQRLGEWLDEYSLGQLWEKNEFGGRPGERISA